MGWVGNNYWIHPPFFSRHLVAQNAGNIIFVCYFLNIGLGSKKVNVLLTSPSNQFRDYFIWNRIEKLMPQLWNFPPHTLTTLKKTDQLVFKPWLFAEIWVSKNLGFVHGLSMDCPWIFSVYWTPLDIRLPCRAPHNFCRPSAEPKGQTHKHIYQTCRKSSGGAYCESLSL